MTATLKDPRETEHWDTLRSFDRRQIRALQLATLKARLKTLRERDFFRNFWADTPFDIESIDSFDDFAEVVPRMSKRDVIADQAQTPPFGSLLGVDRADIVDIHLTSGTSGIGQGAFGLTAHDARLGGLGYLRFWENAGIRRGDLVILTHPVSFLAGGRLALAAAQLMGVVVYYGFGIDKRVLLRTAQRLGVAAFFGVPAVLRDLQKIAREEGIEPNRDLTNLKAICLGLTGPPWRETVGSISDFWGVPVHENYGLTEGLSVAVSCDRGVWNGERRFPMHFMEDILYCEVLDPDTGLRVPPGGTGELTITTFRREASPVVRYRTGDRVVHVPWTECACGVPFDGILPGEISRYDDMVKIKGTTVWPATVDEIVFSHPAVDEYRVILDVVDGKEEMFIEFALAIEMDDAASREIAMSIANQVKVKTLVTPRVEHVRELRHFDFKARRWADRRGHDASEAQR